VSYRDPTSLVDLHNHLVPGVDDGARDVAATLHSVERMTRLSIRRIITTPHIEGSLTLDPDRLDERLSLVTEAWAEAAGAIGQTFPEVEFRRGHEVMLDIPDVDFSDPRIRLAGTSFVLIEWPRFQLPPGTPRVLARVRSDGYRPIVAHPERYSGMEQSLELAARWREAGAYLQVNYGSLLGRYGEGPQTTAFRLLRRGWVDYLASDFHGHPTLKIYKNEAWAALEELGAHDVLVALCRTNPGRVLSDEEPLPIPSLQEERGFWARIREFLTRESA